jgi:hypothetical protein
VLVIVKQRLGVPDPGGVFKDLGVSGAHDEEITDVAVARKTDDVGLDADYQTVALIRGRNYRQQRPIDPIQPDSKVFGPYRSTSCFVESPCDKNRYQEKCSFHYGDLTKER